jgi:hypothetical protein
MGVGCGCVSKTITNIYIYVWQYANDVVEFRPAPGDMLIWHPRSVHKVDGAPNGDWKVCVCVCVCSLSLRSLSLCMYVYTYIYMGLEKVRVLGGTVAVVDAFYYELSLSL